MSNKLTLRSGVRTTIKFIAGLGAATIATQIVKSNTSPNNVIQVVTIPIGAFAIGSALAEVAMRQIAKDFDEIVDAAIDLNKQIKQATTP